MPRYRPDGSQNAIRFQRLKDKVGNRSNSSSEVEFKDAWGVLVGEEGRGISTLIEMATFTRLDCALSSAGFIRHAFAQALHYTRNRHAFGKALVDQPLMTELLADMALESEAATLLAMDLASRFGSATALDAAWRRVMTPVAKFWNCKRAVGLTAEAMEVFGGNGYVETRPMGRLFREAPVNSIWEGSGNVMCLDLLRAISRNPDDARLVFDSLRDAATQAPAVLAQLDKLRDAIGQPPDALEREARRFTQRLALVSQACLMLRHASGDASSAFIGSRFDPEWGPVIGVSSGTTNPAALLGAAWA
jgi:putative acyl-CoA dehydrogenase